MTNILVVMPVEEEHKLTLQQADPEAKIVYKCTALVTDEELKEAEIIIGNVPPKCLEKCENLKLLQLNSAGTDGYTAPGVMPEGAELTNATGSYGLAISEHMMGMLLCMMKKLDLYRLDQEQGIWTDHGSVTSIYGSKTLVVGMGDIGSEFAKRMHAMGSRVTAIRRHKAEAPEYIEKMCTMEELLPCLEEADIVATCLPGTKETYKIFDKEAFGRMKKGAYFINVGRGNAVDSASLCEALNAGHLAGAALDVTDPEPLPAEHPLWKAKGILITPHVSGGYHLRETHDRIIEIGAKNIGHYIKNEPFENVVDRSTGYRKTVL